MPAKKTVEAPMRLQKFMAEAGIASRRKSEEMIREGRVELNGQLAEIGQRVRPEDKVQIDGRTVRLPKTESLTLIMNKPKGVLCTNFDPHDGQTVFTLLPEELQNERLFCAGRLDKDSEGMLILTNDGDLANRITHPSGGVVKRYRVMLNRPLDGVVIPKMLQGVTREGELLFALKVIPAPLGPDKEKRCEVHLQQGRKREIRRIFEAFGYRVKKLKRIQMGKLVMKKLPPGAARPLTRKELELLFEA